MKSLIFKDLAENQAQKYCRKILSLHAKVARMYMQIEFAEHIGTPSDRYEMK